MSASRVRTPPSGVGRLGVVGLDCLIGVLLGIWVVGGISWQGHVYLRHGADPRRAALLVGVLAFLGWARFRAESYWSRGVRRGLDWMRRPTVQWAGLAVGCLWAILISVLQCLALRVTMFDVGIFHQILWSLSHGLSFHSTVSRAGNFLMDHFSPSLVILVPFFVVSAGSPLFLPVAQCLLIFGGAGAWLYLAQFDFVKSRIPCFKWAAKDSLSDYSQGDLGAGVLIFILSFESLWRNVEWGFHENAIAFCSLSWGLVVFVRGRLAEGQGKGVLTERQRWLRDLGVFFLFLIAALSKEILLLDTALIFLGWACFGGPRSRRLGTVLLVGVAAILVLGFVYFERMPHPADKNYFNRYYSYLGNDLGEVINGSLKSPRFLFQSIQTIFETIGTGELLKYVWIIFSPWLFLPLLAFKRSMSFSWILMGLLPSMASAALATYYALRKAEFHYVLELWPVLAVLTILFLVQQKSSKWIWAWAGLNLIRMDYDPIAKVLEFGRGAVAMSPVRAQFSKLSSTLPVTASIAASEMTGPWFAGRSWVTRWPDVSLLPGKAPDYYVLHGSLGMLGVSEGAPFSDRELLWTSGDWHALKAVK